MNAHELLRLLIQPLAIFCAVNDQAPEASFATFKKIK